MRNATAGLWVLLATFVGCAAPGSDEAADPEIADPGDVAQAVDGSLSGLAVWAKSLNPVPIRVASDGAGNAYTFARTFPADAPASNLVTKNDPYGDELFRRELPHGDLYVTVARDGSMAFAGQGDGEAKDFGCGARTGSFVAKVAANGTCVFHTTVDGTAWRPTEVRIAPNGDVVTLGTGDGVVDFGAATFTADAQLLVARFDGSGAFEWARMFGEARAGNRRGLEVAHDLELDGTGRVYFIGVHFATIDFGGGTLAAPPAADPPGATFLAVLSANGSYVRARSFGASNQGSSLAVMADGRAAVAGTFSSTIDFGEKSLTNSSQTSDGFIAVFDPNGAARWAKKLWGDARAAASSVDFDADGYVVVAGDVETVSGASTSSLHIGPNDFMVKPKSAFAARFTPVTGATKWARIYSASTPADGSLPNVRIHDMAVTPNNARILLAGQHSGTVDFGRGKTLTTTGGFLTRLYP